MLSLLIEPFGIEIWEATVWTGTNEQAFNRTFWN